MIKIEDLGDDVRAIVFDRVNSPHNYMNQEIVDEIRDAVLELANDNLVKGVVIASAKKSFLVGGDLKELQTLKTPGDAASIIEGVQACMREIELAPKPFVAAINGLALGGGLEVALACTYRISADDPHLKLGMPEVSLGLIPGAGGTQRLPRLVGLAAALPILVEDRQVTAKKALEIGLIDETVPAADLLDTAKDRILSGEAPTDQPWDRDGFTLPDPQIQSEAGQEIVARMWTKIRRRKPGLEPAPEAIMLAVEAGLALSIDDGLTIEREKFAGIASSQVVKNKIRTLFLGLNSANGMKDRPSDVAPYEIKSVGVIGVGLMGSGIAYCAAQAGYDVYLLEADQVALDKGIGSITRRVQGAVNRSRMTGESANELLSHLKPVTAYGDISGVDMVFEAVSERRDTKDSVTAAASAAVRADVPLASNTSTIPISRLAESASHPERFIGLHFFAPVDRMKLVEVIKGERTDKVTLARALDAIAGMRKTPIVVKDGPGFYTSRVVATYTGEALTLLAEGFSPALIDDVALKAGMPIGPLSMVDATSLTVLKEIVSAFVGDGTRTSLQGMRMTEALKVLTDAGRTGKAGGGGIYDYDDSGQHDWPDLSTLFPAAQEELGPDVIERRLLHPQALEAVRAIEEGIIEDPIDADIGSVLGWAFPAAYGGVIGYIETVGLEQFVIECDEMKDQFGGRFEVPPVLRGMATRNAHFYSD